MILTSLVKAEVNFWNEDIYESCTERRNRRWWTSYATSQKYPWKLKNSVSRKKVVKSLSQLQGTSLGKSARGKCDDYDPFLDLVDEGVTCKHVIER